MFPLVIFASFLVVMILFVDPNMLLCATTLSTGLVSGVPNQWYALSLLLLFVALRSRIAGFVLLIPTFVSAAMAPEAAVAICIASIVLFMRRYLDWMVFVLIAASIALVLLVGLPLAVLVVLALLIPILTDIPSRLWRIRAITLWFAFWFAASLSLSYYTGLFAFDLIGVSVMPIPLVVFAAFAIQSFIVLGNDSHAALSRSIVLLASVFLFAELAVFAIPLIIAIMAVHLERSIGEERLRGSRMVALVIIVFALFVSFEPSSEPIDVERAIVFAPDYLELACEGRAYPDRLSTWRDLAYLSSIGDPNRIAKELAQRDVSEVVYAIGFDEPIVFALTYANASFEERDGFIVASVS